MGNPNIPPTTPTSTVTTPPPADGGNEVRSFTSDAGLGRGGSTPDSGEGVNSDVIATLNELIETSKDGEKGFALAANDAHDPALVPLFTDGEQSCRTAAKELQEQVRALGGNPDEGGSVKGAVHRGWMSLKSAASSRDAKAILEECERGEDYAKAKYAAALKTQMPEGVRQLVERQYQGVVSNHDRVRDLRNKYRDQ
jgi:uncharacterized protein (TIGR02284 family)